MAASKSLSKIYNEFKSKSDDLFKEIDNWSARIDLLQKLGTRRTDFSFSDIFKFLEFFNFLSGEYDLLYHGQVKVGEEIITRDYSHDFLRNGHLKFVKDKIRNSSNDNPLKNDMRNTVAIAELNFVPKGTILVERIKKKIAKKNNQRVGRKFTEEVHYRIEGNWF